MRENRITIDMGTTNTRIVLWGKGQQKRGEIIYRIGAKRSAEEGNNRAICDALRNGMDLQNFSGRQGYAGNR